MSVFKNYEPGEPTCRLYVKNIAKQVEEKVGAFMLDPLTCVCLAFLHVMLVLGVFMWNFAIRCKSPNLIFVIAWYTLFNQLYINILILIFNLFLIICLPGPEVHLWKIHQPFVRR